jgi:hypothetical protein
MLLFKKEQKKKLGWCLFVQVMPIKTSVYLLPGAVFATFSA